MWKMFMLREKLLLKSKKIDQPRPLTPRHLCILPVVSEGDSVAKMYIGNWSDYETMMREKFGKDLPRIA